MATVLQSPSPQDIDRDAVRDFYRSAGKKFSTFKSAHARRVSPSPSPHKKDSAPIGDLYNSDAKRSMEDQLLLLHQQQHQLVVASSSSESLSPSPLKTPGKRATTDLGQCGARDERVVPSVEGEAPPGRLAPLPIASAVSPPRPSTQSSSPGGSRAVPRSTEQRNVGAKPLPPIGASEGYMAFLRDQQQAHRVNGVIVESIGLYVTQRREAQASIAKAMASVTDLLHSVEERGNWGLTSRYDVAQLVRDAQLSLQPCELFGGDAAKAEALDCLEAAMQSLHSRYACDPDAIDAATAAHDPAAFAAHRLFLEQSQRRIHLLGRVVSENSSIDAGAFGQSADSLLVSLEESLKVASLESLLQPIEQQLEYAAFRSEELHSGRTKAIAEGEVNVAEKCTYDLLDVSENALQLVVGKWCAMDKLIRDHVVQMDVNAQYAKEVSFTSVRTRAAAMRARCERDLAKMFALREKVEEVECQTAQKVAHDVEQSNRLLRANHEKLVDVFSRIEQLEREVEVLQRERHREILRRFGEKDKDEHRRVEFAQFCRVVEEHMAPLECTIKNMDMLLHASDVMEELLASGFHSLESWGTQRLAETRAVKLEAHKQHVEMLRELVGQVADLSYRKERMIDETDKGIQRAHVEQELLAATFNPNAHKFADIKKRLLHSRTELEDDVRDLRARAAAAVEAFAESERELQRNNVAFVHPITEHEHRILALKARAIEVRAAAVGIGANSALVSGIHSLQDEIAEVQGVVERVNTETSNTVGKTMPLLKSMKKARHAV